MNIKLLIIEDDPVREERLRSWLRHGFSAVTAASAGRAIGILKRDRGSVYSGIVLDHDLEKRIATEADCTLNGNDVVDAIIIHVAKDVPILVHSVNLSQAPVMVARLDRAGFTVERIPMDVLTRKAFGDWLEYVRENSEV